MSEFTIGHEIVSVKVYRPIDELVAELGVDPKVVQKEIDATKQDFDDNGVSLDEFLVEVEGEEYYGPEIVDVVRRLIERDIEEGLLERLY
jgi:hypothetical protein